jgi:2-hydroxy-6-oxonona-2,4-dienedioate hydrolase
MRVHFGRFGGIETRFYRAGRGAPVLLLHGVGMTADSWCRALGPLGQDFDAIAPDLLDNGFTAAGAYAGGPPHRAMLEHLTAMLDGLALDRVAIVGSSFGATLAAHLARRVPERVERLVLVSSGSVFKSAEALVAMYEKSYANGRAALLDPTVENCRRRLANIFHDPARIPDELLQLQLTPYALPGALASFERRLRGMMDLEAMREWEVGAARLREIAQPMLALWGRQDPRGEHAEAAAVFATIPHARFVTIDACGHLPHLEQHERFNQLTREFLAGGSRA